VSAVPDAGIVRVLRCITWHVMGMAAIVIHVLLVLGRQNGTMLAYPIVMSHHVTMSAYSSEDRFKQHVA
jgi:hypothetical protein